MTGVRAAGAAASMLVVALLAAAAALPAIDDALVHDDLVLVARDTRVTEPGHLATIWSSDYWPGDRPSYVYRPVTTTSFALVARLGGGQRAVEVALHVIACLLVLALFRSLGLPRPAALVGAALFAVHPLHSEALSLVVGRGELLAAVFGLAFLHAVRRPWSWRVALAAGLAFALALGSKESAVMLPALALLLHSPAGGAPEGPGEARRRLALFGARVALVTAPAVAALFVARHAIFGVLLAPAGHVSPIYNPLVDLPPPLRALNAAWLVLRYLGAMVVPWPLSADASLGALRLLDPPWDARVGLLVLCLAAGAVVLLRRGARRSPEALGAAFAVLALLPVSNLLFCTGVAHAERLAYFPSIGACLALAAIWRRAFDASGPRARHAVVAFAAAVIAVGLALSVRRDAAWRDAESFTAALVRDAPGSALAHGLRAVHLSEVGRLEAARGEVSRALEIAPDWHDAWDTLGELEAARGEWRAAARAWTIAARLAEASPGDAAEAPPLHLRAATAWLAAGDCTAARRSLDACRAAGAGRPPPPAVAAAERLLRARCREGTP